MSVSIWSTRLPEISRFLGIVIRMYYRDHNPPHFHAQYGQYEVIIHIETGEVSGEFPRRVREAALEWLNLHRSELLENWQLARDAEPLNRIEPLE